MKIKAIIDGLRFTREMFLFDPSTGETRTKEQLNDMDRTTVDACEGAIELLNRYPQWIPCSERLPEERDSIFAKLYGTEKWRNAMFKQSSNTVIVTVEYRDGTRQVAPNHTIDGDWNDSIKGMGNVIAWMPLPDPYKEDMHESKSDNTD